MAYEQLYKRHPRLLDEWRHHGQPKVILKTEDEDTLLVMHGVVHFHCCVVCTLSDKGNNTNFTLLVMYNFDLN